MDAEASANITRWIDALGDWRSRSVRRWWALPTIPHLRSLAQAAQSGMVLLPGSR
jgi:hypothetical protein